MVTKPESQSQIAKFQEMIGASLQLLGANLREGNSFTGEVKDLIDNSWDDFKSEMEEACVVVINDVLERMCSTIVIEVEVDYDRPPQEMIEALGRRRQRVEADVVSEIPRRRIGKKRVVFEFFKLNYDASPEDVALKLKVLNLTHDVYAQAAVNEKDKSFADKHPNVVHWKNANGWWRCLACSEDNGRYVIVHNSNSLFYYCYRGYWWFGGVRKYLDT